MADVPKAMQSSWACHSCSELVGLDSGFGLGRTSGPQQLKAFSLGGSETRGPKQALGLEVKRLESKRIKQNGRLA